MALALVLLAGFLYCIYHFFATLPTSFVPNEDQGYGFALVVMPDAASLDRTTAVSERVDAILAKIPGVEKRSMINGYSLVDAGFKTNAATFFITFRDFEERYKSIATAKEQNARKILVTLFHEVQAIEGATIFPVPPPPIPGIGTTGGFEFWVQDTTAGEPGRLDDLTQEVIRKAAARPDLTGLHTTFRATTPQLRADVDRDKATLLGVPIEDVYSAIQAQFGSIAVSQFNQYSQVWWVIL
jgi:multidrug efflux pump